MQRRIQKPYGYGPSVHRFENTDKILFLQRQNIRQSFATLLLRIGCDHRAEVNQFVAVEEHVLGAAQTDAFRSEIEGVLCIGRLIGVCADAEAFNGFAARVRAHGSVADFVAPR